MSLSSDQVARIRDRLPGWEEDFGQLWVLLLGEYGGDEPIEDEESETPRKVIQIGALVRAVKSLGIRWPSQTVCDDFISQQMDDYYRRARRGTLLVGYDPTKGDVVSFLTSHKMLRINAIKYLKRWHVGRMASIDASDKLVHDVPAKPNDDKLSQRSLEVSEELQLIKLEEPKRITRVYEQAALQLYPRLDWSQPGMDLLRKHLLHILCPSTAETDPLNALAEAHRRANLHFQERWDRLSAMMYNMGKGVSPKRREHLERRCTDLFLEWIFLPLDGKSVGELLNINAGNAAKLRQRYREELPNLLSGLRQHYEALREHRSAASKKKFL